MKLRLTFSLLVLWSITYSQVDPVSKEGIAIAGYDVVSYFLSNKPAKGDAKFKSQYDGVTYYFSSIDNQKLFEANPLKYVPQYDGYCALAVSYGQKISINPETYKITNDKLYLFFNGKTSNGKVNSLDTWNKNEEKYFNKAEKWWPDVKRKKYKPTDKL